MEGTTLSLAVTFISIVANSHRNSASTHGSVSISSVRPSSSVFQFNGSNFFVGKNIWIVGKIGFDK
jgi:hypothetical protein